MNEVEGWLQRSAGWRVASLLFQEPDTARAAELNALAVVVPEPVRAGAQQLAEETALRADDYFRVLGPGGCPASESGYDRAAMANRGALIADVAAFYEAFAYPPRLTSDLAPDHIAVELDFLGFLALKIAFAVHDGGAEQSEVARAAYVEFLEQHPAFWIGELRARLEAGGHASFASAAAWVSALVECERPSSLALEER